MHRDAIDSAAALAVVLHIKGIPFCVTGPCVYIGRITIRSYIVDTLVMRVITGRAVTFGITAVSIRPQDFNSAGLDKGRIIISGCLVHTLVVTRCTMRGTLGISAGGIWSQDVNVVPRINIGGVIINYPLIHTQVVRGITMRVTFGVVAAGIRAYDFGRLNLKNTGCILLLTIVPACPVKISKGHIAVGRYVSDGTTTLTNN